MSTDSVQSFQPAPTLLCVSVGAVFDYNLCNPQCSGAFKAVKTSGRALDKVYLHTKHARTDWKVLTISRQRVRRYDVFNSKRRLALTVLAS